MNEMNGENRLEIYINTMYPEIYVVYPDEKHYILINYRAEYSVHMYNWHQFYTKSWSSEHIHKISKK